MLLKHRHTISKLFIKKKCKTSICNSKKEKIHFDIHYTYIHQERVTVRQALLKKAMDMKGHVFDCCLKKKEGY